MGTLTEFGEEDFRLLMGALADSYRRLQPFRERANMLMSEYAGDYGEQAERKRTPLNLMQMAVGIYRRQVAARAPRYLVVPDDPALAPFADDFEGAINATALECGLSSSIDECITQSMFSMGVMKVGLEDGGETFADDMGTHDAGRPFADPVVLDNFVYDMASPRWERIRFAADCYDVGIEAARSRKWDIVESQPPTGTNPGGDDSAIRLQYGSGAWFGHDTYHPQIRVWEIFLPHRKTTLYVQADPSGGFEGARFLGFSENDGRNPYFPLWYERPAGNIFPVAPVAALYDLHDAANVVMAKQIDKIRRSKTVGVVDAGNDETATQINAAKDGQVVAVAGRPQEEIKFGGAEAESIAMLIQIKEMYSYLGGNLDAIGGLARSASTVGQESIIAKGANARIAAMQDRVLSWVGDIGQALAWLVWTNPGKGPRFMKRIADYEVPWRFERKKGNFEDYGISIEPYSMQSRTPSERVADIVELTATVLMPLSPMMGQQGKKFDFDAFMDILSKYKSLPELNRIVADMTMEDRQMAQQQTAERPVQSPVTRRETVRTSVSGTQGPNMALEALREMR